MKKNELSVALDEYNEDMDYDNKQKNYIVLFQNNKENSSAVYLETNMFSTIDELLCVIADESNCRLYLNRVDSFAYINNCFQLEDKFYIIADAFQKQKYAVNNMVWKVSMFMNANTPPVNDLFGLPSLDSTGRENVKVSNDEWLLGAVYLITESYVQQL